MEYKRLKTFEIFGNIRSEEDARKWIWQSKYGGKDFVCPHCGCERFYKLQTRPEVRKCAGCRNHIRVRVGTIFTNSKMPLMKWTRAIGMMMQGKRGISAMEMKRENDMKRYETSWGMLHKIRKALSHRDDSYKLDGVIEMDGASFGKRVVDQQKSVLVAIQSKDWIDERGRKKNRAGFVKIMVTRESARCAQRFVNKHIVPGSMVNTDGNNSYTKLKNVDHDYQVVNQDPKMLDRWLPWVHKFISNARVWILGTHHGVAMKNLEKYLAEYAYRFNRRHDPESLFHRALTACCLYKTSNLGALSG